ncbi:cysteine--tRNA ligase [Marivita sp.]|uniref:cysteine--tRNA ligase n=1 Tax=Marivita sp. TaxID=2003365 RepID=UPI0025B941E7|nr:cysteine--tRNA ligase [Marivita sp.]
MLKVYNTMDRDKVPFHPEREGRVSMYVCGPTTYNYIHIGNARPMVAFDAIRKYLIYRGFEVTYVQNFTDIDDKIIQKAKDEHDEPLALAERYIEEYKKDARALGVREADMHPRVSRHMDDILDMVRTLQEKGYAYEVDGNVYFDVRSFPDYGKLSRRDLDELKSGARVDVDSEKKDPLDFALWKRAKPGEPSWESPWGTGRPGWHIECSAMSLKYVGPTFDIHGGGYDLIFPHHENEIAQSEGYTGKTFANYWLHNGFITVNEEKMSKSVGNFFLVREVLEKFPGEVVRFFLLGTHYRSPLDFSDAKLAEDQKALAKLQNTWNRLRDATESIDGANGPDDLMDGFRRRIEEAMDDDFNTARAIGVLFDSIRKINRWIDEDEQSGGAGNKEAIAAETNQVEILGNNGETLAHWSGRKSEIAEELITWLLQSTGSRSSV